MFVFDMSKGRIFQSPGSVNYPAYSGFPPFVNKANCSWIPTKGPIPQGHWRITGIALDHDTGPFSLLLSPCSDTNVFKRSGFRMHGDSIEHPGYGSHGCIVTARGFRELIWHSGIKELIVIAGEQA